MKFNITCISIVRILKIRAVLHKAGLQRMDRIDGNLNVIWISVCFQFRLGVCMLYGDAFEFSLCEYSSYFCSINVRNCCISGVEQFHMKTAFITTDLHVRVKNSLHPFIHDFLLVFCSNILPFCEKQLFINSDT